MLSKISGFLFMATVNGCFLLFFYNNKTHRREAVVHRCSVKKKCSKKFRKLTGKHLCQSLWHKKKSVWHKCFLVNFAKFLRTPSFTEYLRWVLLTERQSKGSINETTKTGTLHMCTLILFSAKYVF